ncbi:hypothetical protein IFM89_036603 [Coptis chinensis]|uniref:Kinesin-like protein n=1 Tax=Coptis chinensis TaxID=261450 RepID=A0A835LLG5_9MAGN|nr:hypothetical protein IFM89_036603 [Coptis chinensis]
METPSVTKSPKTSSKQSDDASKVRVVVRVRPFLSSEVLDKSKNPICCASVLDSEHGFNDEVAVYLKDQFTSRKECYKLDSFFREENSVNEIFHKEVSPLISGIFHGCNGTVFAYGATGSGKTHTMQGTDELPGIMTLSMSMVLDMCEMSGSIAEISYYEVYMDRCYDLLQPKDQEILVLDDKEGQVHLKGLSRVSVSTMSEFHQVLSSGIQRRKVAHTGLNDVSSRSHGVLVIVVTDGSSPVVNGKLNLIDLAGNEDNRRTGNEGIRLQESVKINQSLFALSNVIYALNNNKSRVPYRESKLTRILQDSLGGNSHSLMVACLFSFSVPDYQLYFFDPKEETPKEKIDMESKLRTWLESKGKTKSTQRMGAFGSPLPSKTPLSTNRSVKKQSSCQSYTKTKGCTDQGLADGRRNLFKSGAPVESSIEMNGLVEDKYFKEDMATTWKASLPEPKASFEDELKKEKPICSPSNNSGASSAIRALHNSLRKVLSPISNNSIMRPFEHIMSKDPICMVFFDPKTPKASHVLTSEDGEGFQGTDTPLDKYNIRSSSLKSSLVHEYLDFLNSASKEELLKLKGIGQKRAEHILHLRETTPLKSLYDLEKIGLSSKQVNDLFRRAARGIFD